MAKNDKQAVLDALDQLDANNDDHWTANGLPRLDVMKNLTGLDLDRDTITKANPKFSREDLGEGAKPESEAELKGETAGKAQPDPDAAGALNERNERSKQEQETIIKNELVTNPGKPEIAQALKDAVDPATGKAFPEGHFDGLSDDVKELDNEISNQESDLDKVNKLMDKLQMQKTALNTSLDRIRIKRELIATRPGEEHVPIREYLNAQQQQREARAGVTEHLEAEAAKLGASVEVTVGSVLDTKRKKKAS